MFKFLQVAVTFGLDASVGDWTVSKMPTPAQIPAADATLAQLEVCKFGMYIPITFVFFVHCAIGLVEENKTLIGSGPDHKSYFYNVCYAFMTDKFEKATLPSLEGENIADEAKVVEQEKKQLKTTYGEHFGKKPGFFTKTPEYRIYDTEDLDSDPRPEDDAFSARKGKNKRTQVGVGGGQKRAKLRDDDESDDGGLDEEE